MCTGFFDVYAMSETLIYFFLVHLRCGYVMCVCVCVCVCVFVVVFVMFDVVECTDVLTMASIAYGC